MSMSGLELIRQRIIAELVEMKLEHLAKGLSVAPLQDLKAHLSVCLLPLFDDPVDYSRDLDILIKVLVDDYGLVIDWDMYTMIEKNKKKIIKYLLEIKAAIY